MTGARPSLGVDARLVARAGVVLLLAALANGFLVHAAPLPRLTFSAHLLARCAPLGAVRTCAAFT